MDEVTAYRCELCSKLFETTKEAHSCERLHQAIEYMYIENDIRKKLQRSTLTFGDLCKGLKLRDSLKNQEKLFFVLNRMVEDGIIEKKKGKGAQKGVTVYSLKLEKERDG